MERNDCWTSFLSCTSCDQSNYSGFEFSDVAVLLICELAKIVLLRDRPDREDLAFYVVLYTNRSYKIETQLASLLIMIA